MKTIKTFVSGLLLSAVFLLPTVIHAAELEPFFTLKLSSVNELITVAEKFASMADVADDAEFRQFIATVKSIDGINPDGIAGFAAVDNEGEIVPMLMLPVTDIWNLEVPDEPEVSDTIRSFLSKEDDGQYTINSPFGRYTAAQKKDYLFIVPEDYTGQVPADAPKLFSDLEKYTLGAKLDLEKTSFDTIDGQIFGPLALMVSMSTPDSGEEFEKLIDVYRQLLKELGTVTWGIAVNPQTAAIEYGGTFAAKKGSHWEKTYATAKIQPTMFSGFRGTPENSVISLSYSATMDSTAVSDMYTSAMMDFAFEQYETLLADFIEDIEGGRGTSEDAAEKAKKVIDSVKKILVSESKKGGADTALSLNNEGTLLFACDTVSLEEIRNLAAMVKDYFNEKAPEEARSFFEKNLKKEYITVEGFKVSCFNVPFAALAEMNEDFVPFKDITLGVYWAVKEMDGKQAIAVAAGLDSVKTEQAFKSALEKTKTSVPIQQPAVTVYMQGIGRFLQTLYPLAEKAGEAKDGLAVLKRVADIFASAGDDATITLDYIFKPSQAEANYRASAKSVEAFVKVIKASIEAERAEEPAIQDF